MSMNTQRITISLPGDVYGMLTQYVDTGNISKYISETVHSRLIEEAMKKTVQSDPVEDFLALRKRTVKRSTKHILRAIHTGRQGYS